MSKTELYSNADIHQLFDSLEKMQHYLLMVKAASLAFDGFFNERCSCTSAESPFSREETAQYFVLEFLRLDPDTRLEEAMGIICELKNQVDLKHQVKVQSVQRQTQENRKTDKASINISIENLDFGKIG